MAIPSLKPSSSHNEYEKSGLATASLPSELPTEMVVGLRIRKLRNDRGFSLRTMAELSGLNINTLSLIENGKTSPSVGTLQQLAKALTVPITAFFESEPISQHIVFTPHANRPSTTIGNTLMENLGKDLCGNVVQPFVVLLEPGAGSGDQLIVHTGHEFVYCLSGKVCYTVEQVEYSLEPGDSLVFEAHLPHRWENCCDAESQLILVLYPGDLREEFGGRHFSV
jgi:quercetin dioxygenase-like cupin family protein/DNA-binding XRE family transcriptional regulator